MDDLELEAYASEEASRLLAHDFSFFNPYTCIIEAHDIPFTERDAFYQKVEEELLRKGEKNHAPWRVFQNIQISSVKIWGLLKIMSGPLSYLKNIKLNMHLFYVHNIKIDFLCKVCYNNIVEFYTQKK